MVGDILQPTHLLFVLIVALLVLGPKRLPEVGRTLGSGIRDFRAAINGESHEHRDPEPSAHISPESAPEPADAFPETVAASTDSPPPLQFAAEVRTTDDADQSAQFESATSGTDEPVLSEPASSGHADQRVAEDAEPLATATAPASGFASALAASRGKPSAPDESGDSAV